MTSFTESWAVCCATICAYVLVDYPRGTHDGIPKVAAEVFFSAQVDFAPVEKR